MKSEHHLADYSLIWTVMLTSLLLPSRCHNFQPKNQLIDLEFLVSPHIFTFIWFTCLFTQTSDLWSLYWLTLARRRFHFHTPADRPHLHLQFPVHVLPLCYKYVQYAWVSNFKSRTHSQTIWNVCFIRVIQCKKKNYCLMKS